MLFKLIFFSCGIYPLGSHINYFFKCSYYDPYRGVIVYFRIVDGSIKKGDRVYFMASGKV